MFNEVEKIDLEGFQDDEIELESLSKPNPLLDNNEIQSAPLLVGMTCDGANILTGRKSWVQKRIMDKCNINIINVHHISHWPQLAVKDSLKELELFKKRFAFLKQIHDLHLKTLLLQQSIVMQFKLWK